MIRTNVDVLINRPVNEVGDFFADVENAPTWAVGITDAHADGPPAVGTKTTWKQSFLGRQDNWVMETTEFEPNKTVAMRSLSGPFPIMYRYMFEPAEGGTRVTAFVESEPGGIFKLAEPLVATVAKRQLRASLENLKDLLEAQTPAL